MDPSISVACGFLGGTIFSVEGGYRVLQHPRPERVFNRIADARWFLAVRWCDSFPDPAGILTHDGQLSFQNQAALRVGEAEFLPLEQRQHIFDVALALEAGESTIHTIFQPDKSNNLELQIFSLAIDPRYGKVAFVRTTDSDAS